MPFEVPAPPFIPPGRRCQDVASLPKRAHAGSVNRWWQWLHGGQGGIRRRGRRRGRRLLDDAGGGCPLGARARPAPLRLRNENRRGAKLGYAVVFFAAFGNPKV